MKILGIDPGSHRVGYAVLDFPESNPRTPNLLSYGTIEAPPKTPSPDNLIQIKQELVKIIEESKPTAACVEELFFVNNITNGMRVSESRGVILLCLGEKGIPVVQPTATQIKKGISSKGNATKKEVRLAIQMILGLKDLKGHDDSWDAIAAAYVGRSLLIATDYRGYGQLSKKSSKT